MAFGYKLFEEKNGVLYPLFIDKGTPVPMNTWLPAENHPTKNFAPRPGWHIGEIPDAPWLKGYDGTDKGVYKSRFRNGSRVWCLVEYPTEVDWSERASQYPKHWMTDRIPERGYYKFKETANRLWIIAGEMKIVRVLSEEERQNILKDMEYDEISAYAKYKAGFEKKYKATYDKNNTTYKNKVTIN